MAEFVNNPQYILEAKKPNTAFILNAYEDNNERFQLVLKLAVEDDKPEYKNSIITFLKVEELSVKEFAQAINTSK